MQPLQLATQRASKAFQDTDEAELVKTEVTAESELIGPFQVPIPLTLGVTEGHTLVDADGLAGRIGNWQTDQPCTDIA